MVGPQRHGRPPQGILRLVAGLVLACSGDPTDLSLAEQGERIYASNCIACHHRDPSRDGPLGPAIVGASLKLIEARVLRAEYPPGYTPKRDTRQMPAQPYLGPHVPALAAYLGAPDGTGD